MTRDEFTRGVWTAYRLGKAGLTQDEFAAVLEIGKLNRRAVAAFERENGSEGREPECSRAGKANERAHSEARKRAAEHGWILDRSAGLWWSLYRCEGDYAAGRDNLLSGLN